MDLQTKTGSTALIFAAQSNFMPVVLALLKAAPNLRLATEGGYTAETLARVSGHMEMALFLHSTSKKAAV